MTGTVQAMAITRLSRLARRRKVGAVLVGLGIVVAAPACGSSQPGVRSMPPPDAVTSTAAGPPPRSVAVVADSEVSDEVIDGIDDRPDITVVSRVAEPGWTIEQLDPAFDEALSAEPDVLVYSAGANNLLTTGLGGTLALLEEHIDRAKADTCVVYVLPSSDTSSLPEPSRSQADGLLAGFADITETWGIPVVSYPEIASAMALAGERFYADGELGGFHPGPQSYGRIIDAMAVEIGTCPEG